MYLFVLSTSGAIASCRLSIDSLMMGSTHAAACEKRSELMPLWVSSSTMAT